MVSYRVIIPPQDVHSHGMHSSCASPIMIEGMDEIAKNFTIFLLNMYNIKYQLARTA